ncbi:MAG: SUMF1/EgtB/PvdO family nonheme iron enzyme [Desulfobacteraceae bacterium]|nr:SUMF1/EgtB/PvdO family nonheme iron enzyme [Desulfobacteraceae bacterium]
MYRQLLPLEGLISLSLKILLIWAVVIPPGLSHADLCPPEARGFTRLIPTPEKMVNPVDFESDIELPMPCGGTLVLRHVCVPAEGFFGDLRLDLGCSDCGRGDYGFMEGRRKASVSGPFTIEDLPEEWQKTLVALSRRGDGLCPSPTDDSAVGFYYFIGKYEITRFQWRAVMEGGCEGVDLTYTVEDPRPRTDISWFEAVEFTRRYTEWLLEHHPETLPRFSGGRFGYIRLPTEAEWEYAARGGHQVSFDELNQGEIFPTNERPLADFAVFTAADALKPPERLAWIGTKCANPLGVFDTAGNAAEIVLDPFRFSLGFRLHGATGGFISKGGSYRKSEAEIMPGRREEMPFFLETGAYRSTDLGFRVVLSGIVTPTDRFGSLSEQWSSSRSTDGTEETKTNATVSPLAPGHRTELPGMLGAEATNLGSETTRSVLPDILVQPSGTDTDAEYATAIIRSAVFTAESMVNYALKRQVLTFDLDRLRNMTLKNLPETMLDALDGDIRKARAAVGEVDASIEGFAGFYIRRVIMGIQFNPDVFNAQLKKTHAELEVEEAFSQAVRSRLDILEIFNAHLEGARNNEIMLDTETVIRDLIPGAVNQGR